MRCVCMREGWVCMYVEGEGVYEVCVYEGGMGVYVC